jgi:hypothetical protein
MISTTDINRTRRHNCSKNSSLTLLLCVEISLCRKVSPFLLATKALRESRGIAVLCFYNSASRPGRFLPLGKTRYHLYRRLGGPQDRSGQVRKVSLPTGIRSPDRPARSQSLYRLNYPAHRNFFIFVKHFHSYINSVMYFWKALTIKFKQGSEIMSGQRGT